KEFRMIALIASAAKFIESPLGKVASYIIGGVMLAGVLLGLLKVHDNGVKNAALEDWNKKQLEQVVKDNQKMAQQLSDIQDIQAKIVLKVGVKNAAVKKTSDD